MGDDAERSPSTEIITRHPAESSAAPQLGHRPALNGLRAFAVTAVILAHMEVFGGAIGVDIFFVLSGFLITVLLLEERQRSGRISLSRFYRRRAFRLIPALALLLAAHVLLALTPLLPSDVRHTILTGAPWVAVYLNNWYQVLTDTSFGPLMHTWSLAVEEQFYLLWPFLMTIALRLPAGRAVTATAAVGGILAANFERLLLCSGQATTCGLHVYFGSDTRADQLLIGCLLAIGFNSGRLEWLAGRAAHVVGLVGAVALMTVILGPTGWHAWMYPVIGPTVIALLAAAMIIGILYATDSRLTSALSIRPLVLLGMISYGVYLWQTPTVYLIHKLAPSMPIAARVLFTFLLTIGLAVFSYLLVERPMLALGRSGRGLRSDGSQPGEASKLPPSPDSSRRLSSTLAS